MNRNIAIRMRRLAAAMMLLYHVKFGEVRSNESGVYVAQLCIANANRLVHVRSLEGGIARHCVDQCIASFHYYSLGVILLCPN